MNKRIDELMRQAGIFKPKEFYQHIDALQLEKFAELIVRECAEQVKNMRVNDYGISGAEIIREHFGVEE